MKKLILVLLFLFSAPAFSAQIMDCNMYANFAAQIAGYRNAGNTERFIEKHMMRPDLDPVTRHQASEFVKDVYYHMPGSAEKVRQYFALKCVEENAEAMKEMGLK